ncbi:CHC2 zinc finger domain-containing protein [Xanthobacter sp.]|uniref:DUF7146 domain-containing protein n=1 Tax=Xanthobacter sp. TaxID=35809 RepID=UPI0025F61D84|nr:CHC2 zinc finger domain-containing protein [Xanthobacter sp.]
MSRAPSSEFAAWASDARAVSVLEVIDRRGIRLKRSGTELVGPCPVCGGTDRFGVSIRKNVFHCRGSGRGGDAISLVQYLDGADFLAACEDLTGRPPPRGEGTRASLEELAAREEDRRRRAAERDKDAATFRERERHRLYGIWRAARPLRGTAAEQYLALRGITTPPTSALRYASSVPYFHGSATLEDGRQAMNELGRGPAMVAAITDPLGFFFGLHITWIDLSKPKGKAEWVDPETGELLPSKKVRGSKQGGAILLVKAGDGTPRRMFAAEGIETVLSVWTAMDAKGLVAPDMAFVSGVDLGNLCGRATETLAHPSLKVADKLGRMRAPRVPGPEPDFASPAMFVPESVSDLLLLGDGDSEPVATQWAIERAMRRHAREGRKVAVAWAPPGRDFNDVLRGAA